MTGAVAVATPANAVPVAKEAASARKRRRRAPVGGAADDCFTCAKRGVKCDRRRPYCSQCLEIGDDCAGYKTQLTWGVGVASRGKLRGLSLPIAKAPPVNPGKCVKSPVRTRTGSTTSVSQWSEQQDDARPAGEDVEMGQDRAPSHPATPFTPNFPPTRVHSTEQRPTPVSVSSVSSVSVSQPQWSHISFSSVMPTNEATRPPNRNLNITLPSPGGGLRSPMDPITEMEYMSPLSHSFHRDDMQFMNSPAVMYESGGFTAHNVPVSQSSMNTIIMESQRASNPYPPPHLMYSQPERTPSIHSHVDSFEPQMSHKMLQNCDALVSVSAPPSMDSYSASTPSQGSFWPHSSSEEESVVQAHSVPEHSSASWPALYSPVPAPSPLIQVNLDLISKMSFFMDYYSNTMCPSMVFIDSPSNPFREHILHLAASSRSLQHAICALAACNLRMKRKLSLGQHEREVGEKRLDTSSVDVMSDAPPEDQPLSEEYQHRNIAVQLLNEQLNDPEKSMHDSVLATILLLSHYRMAESGIAKFHTQFAGVKKILGMRRSSVIPPSRDSAWMEALFTYFDAITASINDREAQLNTSFYGVLPDAQLLPPGAENLVGCDRELFKTIIKLGRLNLLSQHRPVQNLLSTSPHLPTRSISPLTSPLGHAFTLPHTQPLVSDHFFSSPPPPQPTPQSVNRLSNGPPRFDGNGFVKILDDEDQLFGTSPLQSTPAAYDDHRSTFWREWKDARIALQSWEFDAGRVVASLSAAGDRGNPGSGSGGSGNGPNGPTLSLMMHHPHQHNKLTTPQPTSAQVRDVGSLSEAFRYAALLYTERLASPNVPSAHSNFRNLVSQVVYYATSLEAGSQAEKFLLWPLFVAGSECVNELQQNIVRSKCRDIMARSGYMNNLTALDVLERLWAGDWKEDAANGKMPGAGGPRRGPFNWSKCIGGPGVDVEWIMF